MKEITDLRQLKVKDDLEITILWSKNHEDTFYFKVTELKKHHYLGVIVIYTQYEVNGDRYTSFIYQKDGSFYFTTVHDSELNDNDNTTIDDFGIPTVITLLQNHDEIQRCKMSGGL